MMLQYHMPDKETLANYWREEAAKLRDDKRPGVQRRALAVAEAAAMERCAEMLKNSVFTGTDK